MSKGPFTIWDLVPAPTFGLGIVQALEKVTGLVGYSIYLQASNDFIFLKEKLKYLKLSICL